MTEHVSDLDSYDIFLSPSGDIRAPLSRARMLERGFTRQDEHQLRFIVGRTPISLSMERYHRDMIRSIALGGDRLQFRVHPDASRAIYDAITMAEVEVTPLMPVGDFARVGYVEEAGQLYCTKSKYGFEEGKTYRFSTTEYVFLQEFERRRVHWTEERGNQTVNHACTLRGVDRKLMFENGKQFLGHPDPENLDHISDSQLWDVFRRPHIDTIAEKRPDEYLENLRVLTAIEEMGSFTYLSGQRDYIARMAVKDYGYAVGETGVGKTLIAISMITLKGADRTLIIAPKGTIRGDQHTTSQWVSELRRFAPFLQVFELFSKEDYRRIKRLNDGVLPAGVYITYYEAMFQNEAVENVPCDRYGLPKWDDVKFCERTEHYVQGATPDSFELAEGVGRVNHNGVKGIAIPSLATLAGTEFDMVCLDESQHCKNAKANRTKAFIQMEARYRFAFTATPIPNTVIDLFPIMGWLCVPGWWKGGIANAAWPYRLEDEYRFMCQFTSKERDYTQERIQRNQNARYRGKAVKASPIISSPAALLRLLQPTMAFISKVNCSDEYVPPVVTDIRVPMGQEQRELYGHFMNRGNVRRVDGSDFRDHRVLAGAQASRLRAVCTDPASVEVANGPEVRSNFNPKTIAILELIQSTIARGQQIVVVNSRLGITEEIQRRVTECEVPFSRIDSTIPDKAAECDRFKTGQTQVMLMGLNCASGYSFDQCDTLIVGSIDYTPGSFTQAIGRVDRVTSRASRIYCILCDNTIESMMFDTVAMKDDAAKICLHGDRVPRDFQPVDMEEVLADAITSWTEEGESMPESECEEQWPRLRETIRNTYDTIRTSNIERSNT